MKKFWKKKWFWVVVVLVAAAAILGIFVPGLLIPMAVVAVIAPLMVPLVRQEKKYDEEKNDNRGGIHRPMYNVGGGSQGPVNYSARGKN